MVKVTYGTKFNEEPWTYARAFYDHDAISGIEKTCTEIGKMVAAYAWEGASKISIKIEGL